MHMGSSGYPGRVVRVDRAANLTCKETSSVHRNLSGMDLSTARTIPKHSCKISRRDVIHGDGVKMTRRMLKKARYLTRPTPARRDAPFREQGRSERRGEEVRTALRVGRSPFKWILVNG